MLSEDNLRTRKSQERNDILLRGEKYGAVGLDGRNVSCFMSGKRGQATSVFMKESYGTSKFKVLDSVEDIAEKLDAAAIILTAHPKEDACTKLGIAVSQIAAYARRSDDSLTELYMTNRTSDDSHFFVQETPEQIAAMISEASRLKPDF